MKKLNTLRNVNYYFLNPYPSMFIDFRERGRGREGEEKERERKKEIAQLLPTCASIRDQTHGLLVYRTIFQLSHPARDKLFLS